MTEAAPTFAADCTRCAGLCCVVLPFSRSSSFAEDKPAGTACRHLATDFRCSIHPVLADSGWRGCVDFDCFGAGQQVTQVTYARVRSAHVRDEGASRRDLPSGSEEVMAVFAAMRQLHEMRFLLADPACTSSAHAGRAATLDAELADLAAAAPAAVLAADLPALRGRAAALFAEVAAERGGVSHRGAWLMGAGLAGADLTDADLLGADLRDADVRGADLSRALFLTQPQLNAARGDHRTRIPARLTRPELWGLPKGEPRGG